MNIIDLNINNSKVLIDDNYPDYMLINEDYLEWKINDWKKIKPGKLNYSPNFKVNDNIW